MDEMKRLPQGLKPYKRTPTFSAETVPAALLRDHSTKSGVWGLIHVVSGEVIYRIAEAGVEYRLDPDVLGVVEPQSLHSVELSEQAEFFVEFWKAAGS
jgi:tellurite methyltransferase